MRFRGIVLVGFLLVTAGCLGSTPSEPVKKASSAASGPGADPSSSSASSSLPVSVNPTNASSAHRAVKKVYWENGTVVADQGVLLGPTSMTTGDGTFPVVKGATRIIGTLAWTGGAGGLTATILSPAWCGGSQDTATDLPCAAKIEAGGSDPGEFVSSNGTATGAPSPSIVTVAAPDIAKANTCGTAECAWGAGWHATPAIVGATFSYRIEVDY